MKKTITVVIMLFGLLNNSFACGGKREACLACCVNEYNARLSENLKAKGACHTQAEIACALAGLAGASTGPGAVAIYLICLGAALNYCDVTFDNQNSEAYRIATACRDGCPAE